MAGWLRVALCVVVSVLTVMPVASSAPAGTGDVRLGLTAGFSGPTRDMSVELYRGALACFALQNRAGGVSGHPVRLLAADDGYEPGPAIENTVRFLNEDKVVALFSELGTPTVSRVLPVLRAYADRGARLFFPATGLEASRLPPYVRYVFNLRASYREEIEALVQAFVERGLRRIAICYQADAFGRSGWDGARLALAARGLTLVGEATFARAVPVSEKMTLQAAIIAKSDPQAILLVGPGPASVAFIRDYRRQGGEAMIGTVSFVGGEIMIRLLGREARREGLDLEKRLVFSQVTPDWRDDTLPAAREYRQALAELGRACPPPGGWDGLVPKGSSIGFEGFLNAKLLLEVLRSMPDPTRRDDLDAAVASLKRVDLGIGSPVSLEGPRHQGLAGVYLFTAKDGRLVPEDGSRTLATK